MAKVDIWMPIYIGDYLRDTEELSDKEHGAYLLLLMHYWLKGGEIGCDIDRLARVAKTDSITARFVLGSYFTLTDGNYKNKRADIEMGNANNRRLAATENGKKGGRPAHNNPQETGGLSVGIPAGEPAGVPKRNPRKSSSSSSSPIQVNIKHKYGEYDNVLLSDAERDRLTSELGEPLFLRVVAFYSGWKKEKGRVSKDDNLTIRRWVIDAVRKQSPIPSTPAPAPLLQIDPIDPDILETVNRHYAEIEERERARA
jgi:uncharacterized protein YdaU (DUF1376 family)